MKPLITSAIIAASLALAGNSAMAADTYAKTGATAAPARSAVHVAARHAYPVARYGVARPPVDVAQIIGSLFASPWLAPYLAQYGGRVPITHSSGGTYVPYDPPTYDTSLPPDNSAQDAAAAAAAANEVQEMNDTNAMTASMAAAAAQAAADNAAETQQIMNNGGL
jgi:hypothetical protein